MITVSHLIFHSCSKMSSVKVLRHHHLLSIGIPQRTCLDSPWCHLETTAAATGDDRHRWSKLKPPFSITLVFRGCHHQERSRSTCKVCLPSSSYFWSSSAQTRKEQKLHQRSEGDCYRRTRASAHSVYRCCSGCLNTADAGAVNYSTMPTSSQSCHWSPL